MTIRLITDINCEPTASRHGSASAETLVFSTDLTIDMCVTLLRWRHLVNAYEVTAGV